MPDDGSKQSSTVWPLPKFHFQVSIDGASASFTEVSGLDMEAQVIEYRAGDSKVFSPVKMPGLKKFSDVTSVAKSRPSSSPITKRHKKSPNSSVVSGWSP